MGWADGIVQPQMQQCIKAQHRSAQGYCFCRPLRGGQKHKCNEQPSYAIVDTLVEVWFCTFTSGGKTTELSQGHCCSVEPHLWSDVRYLNLNMRQWGSESGQQGDVKCGPATETSVQAIRRSRQANIRGEQAQIQASVPLQCRKTGRPACTSFTQSLLNPG